MKTTAMQKAIGPLRRLLMLAPFAGLAVVLFSSSAQATINNTASAQGSYNSATYNSNLSSVSVGVVAPQPAMQVSKTANPTTNLVAGQVVTYTYTVKNTGNVTLKNISLNDVHNAAGPAPAPSAENLTIDAGPTGDSTDATPADGVWSVLAPGDTITFTATYTVQQADVDALQ